MLSVIRENSKKINEMNQRIQEAVKYRERSNEDFEIWKKACEDFRRDYDKYAFPGGYQSGLEKIKSGDLSTAETAVLYLENTPYCFRSQYVATGLSRALNKITLPESLAERFYKWKESKKKRI